MPTGKWIQGEGPRNARVMLVGEQPGDQEDIQGRPFVGPAGKILDRALSDAGFARSDLYVTNVVKQFRWEPRGKRRIHKKPNALDLAKARPVLEAEIEEIRPDVIVCLGATAAHTLIGRTFKLRIGRGKFVKSDLAPYVMATVHPSSLLRAPDDATRRREYGRFVADLKLIRRALKARRAA